MIYQTLIKIQNLLGTKLKINRLIRFFNFQEFVKTHEHEILGTELVIQPSKYINQNIINAKEQGLK